MTQSNYEKKLREKVISLEQCLSARGINLDKEIEEKQRQAIVDYFAKPAVNRITGYHCKKG